MARHNNHPSATGLHTPSEEEALTRSVQFMREFAKTCGDDDYFEAWAQTLVDRRPLVLLGVLSRGYTETWLMEPEHEGVLTCSIGQVNRKNLGRTDIDQQGYLLHDIRAKIAWMMRESGGDWLTDWRAKSAG